MDKVECKEILVKSTENIFSNIEENPDLEKGSPFTCKRHRESQIHSLETSFTSHIIVNPLNSKKNFKSYKKETSQI